MRMWDKLTAQEFAMEFGLEVISFSSVVCNSLRDANKLLRTFGFWQKTNYHWEMGAVMALTLDSGEITFRRRGTRLEEKERREKREVWQESKRSMK